MIFYQWKGFTYISTKIQWGGIRGDFHPLLSSDGPALRLTHSLLTYKIGRTQSGATLEFQGMWSCWLYESSALSNLVFSIFDIFQKFFKNIFSCFEFLFVYFSTSQFQCSLLQLRLSGNSLTSGKTKKIALLIPLSFGLPIRTLKILRQKLKTTIETVC